MNLVGCRKCLSAEWEILSNGEWFNARCIKCGHVVVIRLSNLVSQPDAKAGAVFG